MEREYTLDSKDIGTPFNIAMTLGKILHFIKPNCVMCILGITIILTTSTSLSSLMNKKDKGPANCKY